MLPIFRIALLCALVCACTERETPPPAQDGIVVHDFAGREVRLDAPAQRIVSLMPTVTDLLIALGEHDRLIARTDYDTDTLIAHLPSLGGGLTPSVEWLASQQPDLVISWPDQGARSLVRQLARVDVPVYNARSESVDDTYRILADVGVLLDVQARADSLSNSIRTQLDSVRSHTSKLPVDVVYVVGIDPPMVAARGTFIDELITFAGGRNIFGDLKLWPQVNLEELVQRDPAVIVISDTDTTNPVQLLRRMPGWRDVAAVRNRRVYRVSPWFFNRSGPTMPDAARELARFFHEQ